MVKAVSVVTNVQVKPGVLDLEVPVVFLLEAVVFLFERRVLPMLKNLIFRVLIFLLEKVVHVLIDPLQISVVQHLDVKVAVVRWA